MQKGRTIKIDSNIERRLWPVLQHERTREEYIKDDRSNKGKFVFIDTIEYFENGNGKDIYSPLTVLNLCLSYHHEALKYRWEKGHCLYIIDQYDITEVEEIQFLNVLLKTWLFFMPDYLLDHTLRYYDQEERDAAFSLKWSLEDRLNELIANTAFEIDSFCTTTESERLKRYPQTKRHKNLKTFSDSYNMDFFSNPERSPFKLDWLESDIDNIDSFFTEGDGRHYFTTLEALNLCSCTLARFEENKWKRAFIDKYLKSLQLKDDELRTFLAVLLRVLGGYPIRAIDPIREGGYTFLNELFEVYTEDPLNAAEVKFSKAVPRGRGGGDSHFPWVAALSEEVQDIAKGMDDSKEELAQPGQARVGVKTLFEDMLNETGLKLLPYLKNTFGTLEAGNLDSFYTALFCMSDSKIGGMAYSSITGTGAFHKALANTFGITVTVSAINQARARVVRSMQTDNSERTTHIPTDDKIIPLFNNHMRTMKEILEKYHQ